MITEIDRKNSLWWSYWNWFFLWDISQNLRETFFLGHPVLCKSDLEAVKISVGFNWWVYQDKLLIIEISGTPGCICDIKPSLGQILMQ